MSGRNKSIPNQLEMQRRIRERPTQHKKARYTAAGDTESGSEYSEHSSHRSEHEAGTSSHQERDSNGLEFIEWPSTRKVSPTISSLTTPQMDMLLDLDRQGVRFQNIQSNVAEGLKGNLAAAISKYMVKAYKFLTAIKPDITIKQAAAQPVLRNRKLL